MKRIAFFDSGIGGLSVLKEAIQRLPHADYMYYADTDNAPYGIKSRDEVHRLIVRAVDFLAQFELDALVMACNTATSVSAATLRQQYDFPIIGMEPAVKPASQHHQNHKKIAVTATSLTLSEKKLSDLISQLNIAECVDKIDLDKLVVFAERFDFSSDAVREYLHQQLADVSAETHHAIVLGCTHFVFYKELIQAQLGSAVQVIDGNRGTINHLARVLALPIDETGEHQRALRVFSSGREVLGEQRQQIMQLIWCQTE